jgi:hypothetical protein
MGLNSVCDPKMSTLVSLAQTALAKLKVGYPMDYSTLLLGFLIDI